MIRTIKSCKNGRDKTVEDCDLSCVILKKSHEELTLTVPLVPPGFNHYVKHTRSGRHYVTSDATAFKQAIAIMARGCSVTAREFEVEATIYLGHKQKGDVDGFAKLILDGLADANVFEKRNRKSPLDTGMPVSDAHVTDLILRKRRDIKNPRTEITVRGL